jgi:endonuclease/exonuclease/phosphatase family metal-dependent hydrolase
MAMKNIPRSLLIFSMLLLLSLTHHAQTLEIVSQDIPALAVRAPGEIRILSYNIKMLPRLLLPVRQGPIKRARLLPEHLIKDDLDVIVFQELFDVRSRRIIRRKMRKAYPYHIGPANKPFAPFVTNSGIVIYSKYPLEKVDRVRFQKREGIDRWAHKGGLLVEATLPNGQKFQVMGTHLQAGGSWNTKLSQYIDLASIVLTNQKPGVPQFLAGDYNTRQNDTLRYPMLLKVLDAVDDTIHGPVKYSADGKTNDLKNRGNSHLIDFILYRPNGISPLMMERYVRLYSERWCAEYCSLSDHNAILMRVILPEPKIVFQKQEEGGDD